MEKILSYSRISTRGQSTELQFREMSLFIQNRDWNLVQQIENTCTGTNLKRPGFQSALRFCRERKVDVVLVGKLDRALQSLRDSVNTLREFSGLGIEFISIKDNLYMTTSARKLMLHIIAAFAAFEADIIKERVNASLDNAKAKGISLVGHLS
jgi:DNA invertase Pin-like site-specific DNA recombinase